MGCDMGWIAATEPDRFMDGFDVENRASPVTVAAVTGDRHSAAGILPSRVRIFSGP